MAFEPFNWECPFCGLPQFVTEPQHFEVSNHVYVQQHDLKSVSIGVFAIGCISNGWGKLTVSTYLIRDRYGSNGGWVSAQNAKPEYITRIRPSSFSKQQPDFIPQALREDYDEACAIRDLGSVNA